MLDAGANTMKDILDGKYGESTRDGMQRVLINALTKENEDSAD